MSVNTLNTEVPRQTVVALFTTRQDANHGISRLMNVGVEPGLIGLLEPADAPRHAAWRRSLGSVIAVLAGAIIGSVLGAFALGLSGLGLRLVGAAAGIAFGGYAGLVFGSWFGGDGGDADEPYFLRAIQDGRILVSAEVPDRQGANDAIAVLYESSAVEVDTLGARRLDFPFRRPLEAAA